MKINDKIAVIDDAITGVITAIEGEQVTILTTDGFEIQFSKNEIVVMNDNFLNTEINSMNMDGILSEKQSHKKPTFKRIKSKERVLPPMEVDLHIHQLTSKSNRMSNYDMLNLQLDTAQRQLDFAIKKRIPKVVFIHGVGEGVLKEELEYLFRRYGNLKYYDADYQKYGRGATEVYIFQNKSN